jgi:hypothetical protein
VAYCSIFYLAATRRRLDAGRISKDDAADVLADGG